MGDFITNRLTELLTTCLNRLKFKITNHLRVV